MKQPDLFGSDTEAVKYPTMKQRAGYRKASGLEIISGRICKNCEYLRRVNGNTKVYSKCVLISMSSCQSSDIALKGTCRKFKHERII
jgi:hypothetical protein